MTTKSSGFSLIELLVVVAILGVLSAIGISSYSGYIASSEKKAAENIMQQISLGQTEYYSGNGSYYEASSSNCTPSSTTSTAIETNLLGGADAISADLNYEMCIQSHASNYMVKAKAKKGTCEITMTAHGTFTRKNC
jgi:prepilin-type N-terminal cleavage/methylation domain-containing protein|tara:strand:+ start:358 stop:768 length:411 start_codon:yes stop_codon:yes gene_type:complete